MQALLRSEKLFRRAPRMHLAFFLACSDGTRLLYRRPTDDTLARGVRIFRGNGNGTFQAALPPLGVLPVGEGGYQITARDINGDGKLDLLVPTPGRGAGVDLAFGNGDGTFQTKTTLGLGNLDGSCWGSDVADFNGDGKSDLVMTDFMQGRVFLSLAQSGGTFPTPTSAAALGYGKANEVFARDLDGDGNVDLLINTADLLTGAIAWMRGKGDGTFETQAGIIPFKDVTGLAFADINKDGLPDIVACGYSNEDVCSIILNTSK